jgi:hypothetical protein
MRLVIRLPILLGLGALLAFGFVACSDDDDDASTGESLTPASSVVVSTSTPFPDNGYQFEISEAHLGQDGYVTLRNYTDTTASLEGLFLCQPPKCVELPDMEVAPESPALVAVGDGEGLDSVVVTDAGLDLAPANGEVALFASDDVNDSAQIRSYLEWGSTPHEATDQAIEAGIWLEGSYAPASDTATRLFRNDQGLWLFE